MQDEPLEKQKQANNSPQLRDVMLVGKQPTLQPARQP